MHGSRVQGSAWQTPCDMACCWTSAGYQCRHRLWAKRLKLAQALLKILDIDWFWAPLVRLSAKSLTSTILKLDYQTLMMHSRGFSDSKIKVRVHSGISKEYRKKLLEEYIMRRYWDGHRRRNIRPPATTDQALRAARPKDRPRAWLLPEYRQKCPYGTFFREIYHSKCPGDRLL